uniref:Toprim-like protein n=1 Tax=Dulem virus 36 TaxID=3145754 RepID=A0AAU8B0H8_9CAUD
MIKKYDGRDLERVLTYYGIINGTDTSNFKIVCPFHEDLNPSMVIDLVKGTFFCFGCCVCGDAYDFVRLAQPELNELQCCILTEKVLKSNAVKHIQTRYKRKRKKYSSQALAQAEDYYYGLRSVDWYDIQSTEEKEVLSYMMHRGFDERALNLAECRVNCSTYYPIIFPILDNGKFSGWVCRTTNKEVESKRKYLYNDGFRKRDTLCGIYHENCVPIICEGYMDYLSFRTRGRVKDVVAILGWHISDEQTKKLKDKGVKTVISALDNDECGIKGTKYLERFFNVVRFPYPSSVKDAGDMTPCEIRKAIKRCK